MESIEKEHLTSNDDHIMRLEDKVVSFMIYTFLC